MKNEINKIGLKYFFKQHKNERIGIKTKKLLREIRYAWYRAWYGYDDVDIYNCDTRFRERMISILQNIKKYDKRIWNLPKESEHYEDLKKIYPEGNLGKNTDAIIDIMILHLRMTDKDFVEKQIFGKCIQDQDYDINCRTLNNYEKINQVVIQNKNCFMKLFSMFYFDL